MAEFSSIADLAKSKKLSAYIISDTGKFLTANESGKVRGDAYQPCLWDLAFLDDSHVTLRCVNTDKLLTATKFMATRFFSGFIGEVAANTPPDQLTTGGNWEIIYAGKPGRFHLRSAHGLLLSISEKGRVRAEMDLTAETNMQQVTFRLKLPSAAAADEASDGESGDELTSVWNELDYADEHHSIVEAQMLEKAKKAVIAQRPALKDSKDKSKHKPANKPVYVYAATPLPWPLTQPAVAEMVQQFNAGVLADVGSTKKILEETKKQLSALSNVNKIDVPAGVRLTVVGDLHGQLQDLLQIFTINGEPSPQNWYLFNGDFVDRGSHGIEVLLTIYSYRLLYPNNVFFNRGNHETRAMNAKYQFEDEMLDKYNKELYLLAEDSFDVLPLCSVVNSFVFVVHGGLFTTVPSMKDLVNINRKREIPIGQTDASSTLMIEMLWSDPRSEMGRGVSKRGAGVLFGPDVTQTFLVANSFDILIRSHEVAAQGYNELHGGKCVTLFSASHYCGKQENRGAVALFTNRSITPSYASYYVTAGKAKHGTHRGELKADAIQQLKDQIFHHRGALKKYWKKHQHGKRHTISVALWAEGLNSVLGVHMKWHKYTKEFAKVDSEGLINYKEFLASYRLSLSEQTYRQYETLLVETCAKVYSVLGDFANAFRAKDTIGTGVLPVRECASILQSLDVGLNASGIAALLETLQLGSEISLADFTTRFKLVYEQKVLPQEPWIPDALVSVGEALLQRRVSFTDLAKSNGLLSYDDFSRAVKDLTPSLTHEQRKTLAKYVDTNQNGSIDLKEFSAAFKVKPARPDAWRVVVDRLIEVFYEHRQHLKNLFRLLDTDNSGALDFAEFRAGLHGLNVLIDNPLTEDEMQAVFRLFDKNDNQLIDYDEFVTFLKDLHVDVVD